MPKVGLTSSSASAAALLWLLILCFLRLCRGYQPLYGFDPDDGVLKVNRGDLVRVRNQRFRSALCPDNQHIIHAGFDDVFNRSYRFAISLRDDGQADELEPVVGAVRQRDDILFPNIECCAAGDCFGLCAGAEFFELDNESVHATDTGACNGYRLLREEEPATRFKPLRKVRQDFYFKFALYTERATDATYCYVG